MELEENIRLIRDKNTKVIGARTWATPGVIGIAGEDVKSIRDCVKDMADKFCNDYLTANPIVAKKKVVLLAGAAGVYYWYTHHNKANQNPDKQQYYISKSTGRIYYRDKDHRAHWVTPPQATFEVPEDEAKQYSRFKGYNNQKTGDDLSSIIDSNN